MRLRKEKRELMMMMMENTICLTSWNQKDGEIKLTNTMSIKEDLQDHFLQVNPI